MKRYKENRTFYLKNQTIDDYLYRYHHDVHAPAIIEPIEHLEAIQNAYKSIYYIKSKDDLKRRNYITKIDEANLELQIFDEDNEIVLMYFLTEKKNSDKFAQRVMAF